MIELSIKLEIKLSAEPIGVALDTAGIEVQLAGLLRLVVDCLLKHTVQCSLLRSLQLILREWISKLAYHIYAVIPLLK